MLINRTSIAVLVTIIQVLSHGVRSLPTGTKQNQRLKNEVLSTPATETLLPIANETVLAPAKKTSSSFTEETLSPPAPGALSSATEEIPSPPAPGILSSTTEEILLPPAPVILLSPTEETLGSPANGTLLLSTEETISSLSNETLLLTANETLLLPGNETSSVSTNETLSPPAPGTLSSPTEGTLGSPANRTLLLPAEGTISSISNETLLLTANETLLLPGNETSSSATDETVSTRAPLPLSSPTEGTLLSSAYNGTESSPVNQTVSSPAKKPSRLPTIMYGPITQQFGNDYQAAQPAQISGEPATLGGSINYGSTSSQNNNRYLTIAQAGDVYLMVPSINGPLSVSVPGLSMHQNGSTGGLIFDLDNPTEKRMEKFITAFNNFQQSNDRIVSLTSPFLTNHEITPLLEKSAKDDFTRQTKEIEWLSMVALNRITLIEFYKLLSSTYNELKLKLEVTPEELDAAEKVIDDLGHLNKELRKKTQDLVLYVLLN
uniref:Uncharacterized protein n=1 Tax=Glyptapanteles flavicoxis TaxID=463051 RepID=B7S890_9HYME|nr:conserved hypothetical protein [Glyptapanteles flavicoxis]